MSNERLERIKERVNYHSRLDDYMSTVDYDEGEIARQALEDGNSD